MSNILLYTTVGCHLCEEAELLLLPVLEYLETEAADGQCASLVLHRVEITDDETLVAKYGVRIPVIRIEGSDQELGWPFDQEQAYVFLSSQLAETGGN